MTVRKYHYFEPGVIVVLVTVITCAVLYKVCKPNAYEVAVNGNAVAYVVDKEKAEGIIRETVEEFTTRFKKPPIEKEVTFNRIIAEESALSGGEYLKKNLQSLFRVKVNALKMTIDGEVAAIVANEEEGEKIVNHVAQYYLQKSTLEDKIVAAVRSSITYIPVETYSSLVECWEEAAESIITSSEENGTPRLLIEIRGKVSEEVPAKHATVIKWCEELENGKSRVDSKGEDGVKRIEKWITLLNDDVEGEEVIKEDIIVHPKDEIVVKGTKSTAVSNVTAMAVPSRGSVSSAFGMRWGRMHNGIDIAADMGTPIHAALDGTVTYSGWEDGFGYVVKIMHDDKLETLYAHCSVLRVKKGQEVKRGEHIADVGSTGRSTGPHLHFEVRINGVPQNPYPYLWKN